MIAYRIGSRRHPIFDGTGAAEYGARIRRSSKITIPDALRIDTANIEELPGWSSDDFAARRAFGDRIRAACREPGQTFRGVHQGPAFLIRAKAVPKISSL